MLAGLRLAYLGDGNNVAHSLMEACALAGIDVASPRPQGYEPDLGVVATARASRSRAARRSTLSHDPREAVTDADAVYTDVWVSMGDDEEKRDGRSAALAPYQVNARAHGRGRPRCRLHALSARPPRPGSDRDVIDGPQSVVLDQAENRMHTAQALLVALLEGRLQGAQGAAVAG